LECGKFTPNFSTQRFRKSFALAECLYTILVCRNRTSYWIPETNDNLCILIVFKYAPCGIVIKVQIINCTMHLYWFFSSVKAVQVPPSFIIEAFVCKKMVVFHFSRR